MAEQRPDPQKSWNPLQNTSEGQTQVVAVVVLLAVVALIIGGLYLAQATTNITTVRDIEELRQERNRLQRENEGLKADIARLQSIDTLMTRAATIGFEPAGPDDIVYLPVDGYVYDQPTQIPTSVQPTPTSPTYEENFAGWLNRQFDALRDQFSEWAQ